jgi:N-acetylneuraminate lyase
MQLHGLVAAPHSPFHPDGSLAAEVVAEQAAHLAGRGVGSVFIAGTTGEAASLTRDERVELFEAWASAREAHGMVVVAHVGSNCLEDAKHLMAAASGLGLDAAAMLSPSYFKPESVELLIQCCAVVAGEAADLPFYYYDIPTLTAVRFSMVEFLRGAAGRVENLVGIKYTNDDLEGYGRCLMEGGFDLPWGIDERLLDALVAGARGAVGSSYNFAAPIYQGLIAAYEAGDMELARAYQARAVRVIEAVAATGYLGTAKVVMGWQGVAVGPARLPLGNPVERDLGVLRGVLEEEGLLP